VAILAAAGAAWFFRMPIADRFARDALAGMGLDADFQLTRLDLGGAGLSALRIGPENSPDVAARTVDLRIGWSLTGPKLVGVRLVEPALRVAITEKGVSLGSLDKIQSMGGGGSGRLPDMTIEIIDGRGLVSTPYGVLPATVSSQGRLTRNFTATADIAPVTIQSAAGKLDGARLSVRARTEGGSLLIQAESALAVLDSKAARASGLSLNASAAIPREIRGATVSLRGAATGLGAGEHGAAGVRLEANLDPAADKRWRGRGLLTADTLFGPRVSGAAARVTMTGAGDFSEAVGEWTLRADRLRATSLDAARVTGAGAFAYDGDSNDGAVLAATGSVTLPEAGFDAQGRREVLQSVPTLAGSPLGGLFGSGRAALDRALTKFSTAATLRLDWRGGHGRLTFPGPVTVQAESGAVVTATPIENGRPALLLLLPSGEVSGGVRIAMEGGGLPARPWR
jgi:hypothetical protein